MSNLRQSPFPARAEATVRSIALRLPSGHRIKPHAHGWAQIIYAARGVMSVEAVSKLWLVPPLRCLWVPAGVPHGIETIGETWMRTVYVRPDLATPQWPDIRVAQVSPLLRELILETVRLGALNGDDPVQGSMTTLLIAEILAAGDAGLALPLPVDRRGRAVAERVCKSPGENTALDLLTHGIGASPRTVERLFIKETGMSFGRWRQQARLQLAIRLLAEGLSVTQVAMECGYESVSAFVTMFKRALGATPGQYIGADREARRGARPRGGIEKSRTAPDA